MQCFQGKRSRNIAWPTHKVLKCACAHTAVCMVKCAAHTVHNTLFYWGKNHNILTETQIEPLCNTQIKQSLSNTINTVAGHNDSNSSRIINTYSYSLEVFLTENSLMRLVKSNLHRISPSMDRSEKGDSVCFGQLWISFYLQLAAILKKCAISSAVWTNGNTWAFCFYDILCFLLWANRGHIFILYLSFK